MDHSEVAENKILAKEAASVLEAGGILQITLEGTRLTLTSEDIREYARYRQVGLACKEVNPSVTVLGPTDFYSKYRPKVISKQ
jgi:hypothetical protein